MKVNTEICEQIFSWLSGYCHITKHMNRENVFFILYICDLHNMHETEKLQRSKFL